MFTNNYIQSLLASLSYIDFSKSTVDLIKKDLNSIDTSASLQDIVQNSWGDEFQNMAPSLSFFSTHFEILNDVDSLGDGQTASTFLKKNE